MRISAEFLKQNFNIDSIDIFSDLFQRAELELLEKPAGSKIMRVKERCNSFDSDGEEQSFSTPSSFLRVDGPPHVVMLASGEHRVLGVGTSAKVKLAIDKEGNLYAVKIFEPPRSLIQKEQIQAACEEHRKLNELNIASGGIFFSQQKKFRVKLYSVQQHLGQSLHSFLENNPHLSFKARIYLAIALALKLEQLHTGALSQAGTPYVHFDLKPKNITVQPLSQHHVLVHLVDLGSAEMLVTTRSDNSPSQKGSLIYLPVDLRDLSDKYTIQEKAFAYQQTMGMRACDLIALKRILNFHPELLAYSPATFSIFRGEDIAQLSPAVQHLLSSLEVNTTAPDESALFIAAALANELSPVNERHELSLLKANPQLQHALVRELRPERLSELLESNSTVMHKPQA